MSVMPQRAQSMGVNFFLSIPQVINRAIHTRAVWRLVGFLSFGAVKDELQTVKQTDFSLIYDDG